MPLARALRDQGHDVHWMVTQPAVVGDFLASEGFTWLAAPMVPEVARQGPPLTYADILLRFGYANPRALFGLVGSWREAMRLTGADLVLADHAPTALLAARTLDIPVMLFSNGFTAPPQRTPLPNMRPWAMVPEQTVKQLDHDALAAVNEVLQRFECSPLINLASLFDVTEEALVTFPELDHYADRGPARYWGSLPSAGAGKTVNWPTGRWLPPVRLFTPGNSISRSGPCRAACTGALHCDLLPRHRARARAAILGPAYALSRSSGRHRTNDARSRCCDYLRQPRDHDGISACRKAAADVARASGTVSGRAPR